MVPARQPLCTDRVYELVSGGRLDEARALVDSAARGRRLADTMVELLEPLVYRAGADTSEEIVGPEVERGAVAIAWDALRRLSDKGVRKVPCGPRLVAARPAGEPHALGLGMVSTLLWREGWQVVDAGPTTPAELVHVVRARNATLVCLSATGVEHLAAIDEMIRAVRCAFTPTPPPRLMVGGLAFRLVPERAVRVGADLFAEDARAAVETVRGSFGRA